MNNETLIPKLGVVTDIRQETPDVKTFRVNAPEGGKVFEHMPGQCAMLSIDVYKRQAHGRCHLLMFSKNARGYL